LAELLDLLAALARIAPADPCGQREWLTKTHRYALGKSILVADSRSVRA
jgi:hypothetical protein